MKADLYLESINFQEYLPKKDCWECGSSCNGFAKKLKEGESAEKCPYLSKKEVEYLNLAAKAHEYLEVPIYPTTIKTKTGLVFSKENGVTLVTGNYPYTQAVVAEVMVRAGIEFNMLIIDTEGYSVDMAVYLGLFNGERFANFTEELKMVDRRKIIIPGLASKVRDEISKKIGFDVITGPICCAEIPIFLLKKQLL